jgi:hypothetical protein
MCTPNGIPRAQRRWLDAESATRLPGHGACVCDAICNGGTGHGWGTWDMCVRLNTHEYVVQTTRMRGGGGGGGGRAGPRRARVFAPLVTN